jgi:hypothetical protein
MWVANVNDIDKKKQAPFETTYQLLKPYFDKYTPLSIELKIFIN